VTVSHEVGESPHRIRGPLVLAFLLTILTSGFVGYRHVSEIVARPQSVVVSHGSPSDVFKLAQAIENCGHRPGDENYTNIPVIGSSRAVFMRIIEMRNVGGEAWAGDPFDPRRNIRPMTPLEVTSMHSCRYAIDRYGTVAPHEIALTFDDGPDPTWTNALLAFQKQADRQGYDVRYDFFSTGEAILKSQQLFQQILATGNAVGNHSLTHPEFDKISDSRASEELAATSRIISSVGGVGTRLVREPFAGSDQGANRAGLRFLLTAQMKNLVPSGFTIDSRDWEYERGDKKIPLPKLSGQGEVIIMHDGGSRDRSGTLDYVAGVIQLAQRSGYHFVTMDELLKRADGREAMHKTEPTFNDKLTTGWYGAGLFFSDGINQRRLLAVVTILMLVYFLIVIMIALTGSAQLHRKLLEPYDPEKVGSKVLSILIAAHDEEWTIQRTVASAISCHIEDPKWCPFSLQIVVVDDGSNDDTWWIIQQLASEYGGYVIQGNVIEENAVTILDNAKRQVRVDVIRQENGGKASALTTGYLQEVAPGKRLIEGAVVLQIDADTALNHRLDPNLGASAIGLLAAHFNDPNVVVACGRLLPKNLPASKWTRLLRYFQEEEYRIGAAIRRTFEVSLGSMGIVPGAFSMWRISALPNGVPSRTKAEDYDAAMEVRQRYPEGTFLQEPRAIAFTQVPTTLRALYKQQLRWCIGPLQVMWARRQMMFNIYRYGALSWHIIPFGLPSLISSAIVLPMSYALAGYQCYLGRWPLVIVYFVGFTLLRMMQSLISMLILKQWSWTFLTALYYRLLNDPLQVIIAWRAIWAFSVGKMKKEGSKGWKSPERVREEMRV
jgi:cellulose synthase/poly-beta-1,6-N-acetylglucosamine synthase-like glycosyltransferase/peptidoglycan/xylan/chitin deacetylase (PgdA/CDA1 family)